MKKIQQPIYNELIINKSKFITNIYRVDDINSVVEILKSVNKKYYDANHNCYAYIIGDRQETQKCSDDKEPAKTAGYPILDVLLKQELTNILCVVTRYFGGVLLGAGGLIRAYSNSCSEALKKASFFQTKQLDEYKIKLSYSYYNTVLSYLNNFNIISTDFTDLVEVYITIEQKDLDDFKTTIINMTSGSAILTFNKTVSVEVLID